MNEHGKRIQAEVLAVLRSHRTPMSDRGDCVVVWKLDRLGRSLSPLLRIVTNLQTRDVAFRSLTDQIETTARMASCASVYSVRWPSQYKRALTRARGMAGLEAANRRGGRPYTIREDTMAGIRDAMHNGASKAAVCRTFGVKHSTLDDALARETGDR